MTKTRAVLILSLVIAAGAVASYGYSHRSGGALATLSVAPLAAAAERTILYYRDPAGAPFWSATPKNDAQGRDNLRVRRPRLASDLGIGFLVQPQHQGQHGGPDHVRLIGTRHEHPYGIEPGKPQKRSRPGLEIFAHPHSMQAREAIDPIDQRTDR